MLRISVTSSPEGTTIILEGRVVGAWVEELCNCWGHLRVSAARPIRVNLDGVTFIDADGKAVLRAMHADRAVLTTTGVMMRAVVDEVTALPTHPNR